MKDSIIAPKGSRVAFFTTEEAARTPGAVPGFNAVTELGNGRVRYELLHPTKADKDNQFSDVVVAATPAAVPAATRKRKEKQVVVEQDQPAAIAPVSESVVVTEVVAPAAE